MPFSPSEVASTTETNIFTAKQTFTEEVELSAALNHDGTTVGFYGTTPATQPATIADPTAPGAAYLQAEIESIRDAVISIRNALRTLGIIAT